jgi:hypothetical protein
MLAQPALPRPVSFTSGNARTVKILADAGNSMAKQ